MVWFLVAQIFSTLISLIQIGRMYESNKDLEIMVLRYQLGIAERKLQKPVRANRAERMPLTVLVAKPKKQTKRPASQFRSIGASGWSLNRMCKIGRCCLLAQRK